VASAGKKGKGNFMSQKTPLKRHRKHQPKGTTHRGHRQHPGEIDINLDSKDSNLKPLLDELNPILKKVIKAVESLPAEQRMSPVAGGYHNITYCCHEDDDEGE
jgi:hypothetical protein